MPTPPDNKRFLWVRGDTFRYRQELRDLGGVWDPNAVAWRLPWTVRDIGEAKSDPTRVKQLIREAQAKTHPDAGGDAEQFRRVQAAATLLKEKMGL